MKKLALLLTLILGISFTSLAGDTYSRSASALPESAKVTLARNFKAPVSFIKTDKTLGFVTEYDVILTDGTEINFDRNGNWESIEIAANQTIPNVFIVKGITDYINKNFPGQKILGISKEGNGFEVELSNSIEMKFDKNGNFIRYDD